MAVTSTIMLISNAQSNAHTMGLIPFLKSHDNYMPDASLPVKLTLMLLKGQLISECLLGVIDFPKKQQKI